ncbi:uncharacterized protein involved in exopolysaccharide biosynthesis [Povalibacter uvarum]|uniref:Uncharacterized protein involved in exopolysaccharide biosynthesis n=1 Tax=Povalibacter uvarum TaxID=732238 RepID=A0A841HGY5_9GAMM|nr:Wzz/FepE/Etk N-terminal domain-containing protein [Povalibacter uvarum]MBB6091600.1 uncharacterized protein involved in exopolysaccharide biosynthesis [Povalibacter uvarum]
MADASQLESEDGSVRLLVFLVRRTRWLLLAAFAGLILGVAVAYLLRPLYRAEVKLVAIDPAADSSSLTQMMGRLGGLADLAGLNQGLNGGSGREVSVEILESRAQAHRFIESAGISGVLDGRGDAARSPVSFKAMRRFVEKVRVISEDRRSGIITVAVYWEDPVVAARWANEYVALFNEDMRSRAAAESQRNLSYLEKRLASTSDISIREALSKLIEVELKTAMLADVRTEYAAKIVDGAVAPDPADFARPRRGLIVAGSVGLAIAMAIFLMIFADMRTRLRAAGVL